MVGLGSHRSSVGAHFAPGRLGVGSRGCGWVEYKIECNIGYKIGYDIGYTIGHTRARVARLASPRPCPCLPVRPPVSAVRCALCPLLPCPCCCVRASCAALPVRSLSPCPSCVVPPSPLATIGAIDGAPDGAGNGAGNAGPGRSNPTIVTFRLGCALLRPTA